MALAFVLELSSIYKTYFAVSDVFEDSTGMVVICKKASTDTMESK